MLSKKNIKEIENVYGVLVNSDNNHHLINSSIQKVNDIASHTNNSTFISMVGRAYSHDNLIIENKSNTDTPLYIAYTNCGNTKLGIANNSQIASIIFNIINDAKNLYHQHRIELIANSVNKIDTKRGRKNLLAFFVGNRYGIEKEQENANLHGTHNFNLYLQGGTSQSLDDDMYIDKIKKYDYVDVPQPSSLINNPNNIVKNIKLGKKVMKSSKVLD